MLYRGLKVRLVEEVLEPFYVVEGLNGEGDCLQLVIPDDINGTPVTKIADNAFRANNTLETVYVGSNIQEICSQAFFDCRKLRDIIFPENSSLHTLGNDAFSYSGVTSINLPETLRRVGEFCFYGCSNLSEVRFGRSVVEIGPFAFDECYNAKILCSDSCDLITRYAWKNNIPIELIF